MSWYQQFHVMRDQYRRSLFNHLQAAESSNEDLSIMISYAVFYVEIIKINSIKTILDRTSLYNISLPSIIATGTENNIFQASDKSFKHFIPSYFGYPLIRNAANVEYIIPSKV